MAPKLITEAIHRMTPDEITAVQAGMADLAEGRFLTEEEFEAEMDRYFERRLKELEQSPPMNQ